MLKVALAPPTIPTGKGKKVVRAFLRTSVDARVHFPRQPPRTSSAASIVIMAAGLCRPKGQGRAWSFGSRQHCDKARTRAMACAPKTGPHAPLHFAARPRAKTGRKAGRGTASHGQIVTPPRKYWAVFAAIQGSYLPPSARRRWRIVLPAIKLSASRITTLFISPPDCDEIFDVPGLAPWRFLCRVAGRRTGLDALSRRNSGRVPHASAISASGSKVSDRIKRKIDRARLAACMDWRIAVMRAQTSVGFSLQDRHKDRWWGEFLRWTGPCRAAASKERTPKKRLPAPHAQPSSVY